MNNIEIILNENAELKREIKKLQDRYRDSLPLWKGLANSEQKKVAERDSRIERAIIRLKKT